MTRLTATTFLFLLEPEEFECISELPVLNIARLTSFLLAVSIHLQDYQRIHNYYCQDNWYVVILYEAYFNKSLYEIGLKS